MDVYSFKDVLGAFEHPQAGAFAFAGEIGEGSIALANATERSALQTAADGNVVTSYVAGRSGSCTIEAQQTSEIHKFLLDWFNIISTAADGGDVSQWASATLSFRSITDGSYHNLTGVSPSKVPDKTYAATVGTVTWVLMAADVHHG